MSRISLDLIDKKILSELIINSKQSVKEIASKVNLSVTPVHERIKKLENSGIIRDYTVIVDPEQLGFHLVVYIQIKFVRHQEKIFEKFRQEILKIEEVIEASFTAGDYDALLKIILRDMDAYHDFILHKISKLDIISQVKSSFVVRFITDNKHRMNEKNINFL